MTKTTATASYHLRLLFNGEPTGVMRSLRRTPSGLAKYLRGLGEGNGARVITTRHAALHAGAYQSEDGQWYLPVPNENPIQLIIACRRGNR